MRKYAAILLFIPLLFLTLQPLACGGTTGPALEMPPTPTELVIVTETVDAETAVPTPTLLPTHTPVPDTLVATLVETFPLDAYPAFAPITIQFNQPMAANSSAAPLLLSPFTEGEFSWNKELTALTLTPLVEWQGQVTTITLNPQLRTATGIGLSSPERWRLHHLLAPHAQAVPQTAAIANVYPTIQLQFDQPMEPASVLAALSVDPPLAFASEWKGDTRLAITFTEPFLPEQTYEVRLAETAVSQQNTPLSRAFSWPYHLADSLVELDATVKSSGKTAVRLRFNYPVDPNLSDTFVFSPPVAGTWRWESSQTAVRFTPATSFEPDTTYLLQFTAPLRDQDGLALPAPKTHSFTTPPLITALTPLNHQVAVDTAVRIIFSDLVDHATVEDAITMTPATNGRFSWQDNVLTFTPANNAWEYDTQYTITIAPIRNAADGTQLLKSERIQRFTTVSAPVAQPAATFGSGEHVQQLFANGRRAIQYESRPTDTGLTATLYSVELAQFVSLYGTSFSGVRNRNWEAANTEGLTAVSTWQLSALGGVAETVIPAQVPPGLYLLNLGNGTLDDQLFVFLSDYLLTVKQGNGQVAAWVADNNGRSQPNASVTLYGSNGSILAQATTNNAGVAYLQTQERAVLAAAVVNGQTAVTGLGGSWTTLGGWGGSPAGVAMHIYTDRPIYQPGQTVYYKAIIRRNNDARLDMLPEETAVTAIIRDARNNIVQTSTLQTNSFGTVNGSFAIAEGATLGGYRIEIVALDDRRQQRFNVEEYDKPDYSVAITTDQPQLAIGDPVQITVDTAYYLGEPVPHAAVTLNFFNRYYWYDYVLEPIHGQTDENGRFTHTFDTSKLADNLYRNESFSLAIEATVDDGSHQTVSHLTAIRLFAAAEKLVVHGNGRFHPLNTPFDLQLAVQTHNGEPVNGRLLKLTLTHFNPDRYSYSDTILTTTGNTAANGRLTYPLTLPQPGSYKLQISGTDGHGRPFDQEVYYYAFQSQNNQLFGRYGGLTLRLDKDTYAPGDTAQLFIESDFDGPALLTWERATTQREQHIELTAPVTRVEIPVLAGDAPNIHLVLNAWRPLDTTLMPETLYSLPESRLYTASVNLLVPARDKQLQITLTPSKQQYAPGEEATFTVRVTNPAGTSVSAELSLALVDEAIFALADVRNGSIYETFYYQRSRTTSTYASLVPVRYVGPHEEGGGGGGGGGDEEFAGIDAPRTDFPDTAVWLPTVHTDFNGEAVMTMVMPDSLTSWRLTAVATTADTQVGEASINVQTKQAIIIQPILPQGLTAGDQVQLSVLVQNFSDVAQTISVNVVETAVSPHVSFPQAIAQTVTISPGQREIIGWSVFAGVAGTTALQFNAHIGEQLVDAIALPLEIRPLAIPDVTTTIADFQGEWATTLTQPANVLPQSSVSIELSRSIAGSMLEGLNYLTGYPYGCVEQTMSRALPNAVVSRAFFHLGIGATDSELEAKISASVQRLYGFQHSDGGWGWWLDDDTDAYQTAWVLFGLALVDQAGHDIDSAVLERGAKWLNDVLPTLDPRIRAYALYSLSLAGHANEAAALVAYDKDVDKLDTFGKTALALALYAQGEQVEAQELLDEVVETAVSPQNSLIYWSGASNDGIYHNKTMASDVRTTALVVSALAQMRPGTATEAAAVRWLMDQRRAQGWGTTNETSFAILALTDHLLATNFTEDGTTPYAVWLNDEPIFSGTLRPAQLGVTLEIPADDLPPGENRLVVRQEGENGRLYLTLNHRVYLAQKEIAGAGVVEIKRAYLDVETGERVTAVRPGQLVRVQLRVTLPKSTAYMLVEDTLPSGLEPLNEALNTTSRANYYSQSPSYYWQELGYNHKEIHRGHVRFFITSMEEGTYTFTYLARAVHIGNFTAMPTEAYAMYDLAMWGRSASSSFVIEP